MKGNYSYREIHSGKIDFSSVQTAPLYLVNISGLLVSISLLLSRARDKGVHQWTPLLLLLLLPPTSRRILTISIVVKRDICPTTPVSQKFRQLRTWIESRFVDQELWCFDVTSQLFAVFAEIFFRKSNYEFSFAGLNFVECDFIICWGNMIGFDVVCDKYIK